MNLDDELKKRAEFVQLLKDLAKTQNPSYQEKDLFFSRFKDLYYVPEDENGFRHFYSDILPVLNEIRKNDPISGSFEYLLLNLDALRRDYTPEGTSDLVAVDVQKHIRKLYDHVNLETQRILYSDSADYKLSNDKAIRDITQKINHAEASILAAQERVKENERRIENTQKEYIAILGIFAAIVLAFTGGLAFSSSILEYMHTVSIYRILTIALVIGLVLFNVIHLLVWYINKIVRDEHGMNWHIWLAVHLVMGALMLIVFFCWSAGTVENRNERVFQSDVESSIVETGSLNNLPCIKNQVEITIR